MHSHFNSAHPQIKSETRVRSSIQALLLFAASPPAPAVVLSVKTMETVTWNLPSAHKIKNLGRGVEELENKYRTRRKGIIQGAAGARAGFRRGSRSGLDVFQPPSFCLCQPPLV